MTDTLVVLAGLTQLAVVVASLWIPRVLKWPEQARRLDGLTRQVFWTYAGYILGTNVCFGLVSVLAPHWLTDGSGLARAVCAFIATYWGVRIVLQWTAYHPHKPRGAPYVLADVAITVSFSLCTAVYGGIALGLW